MLKKLGLLLLLFCFSAPISATWQLDDNKSWLSFVTTKRIDTAEHGRFKTLAGTIDDKGQAKLKINLASVDTNIPIRDERIKKFLFQTDHYAEATLFAQLNMEKINRLAVGNMKILPISVELDLHGVKQRIFGRVVVTRLTGDRLLVINQHVFFIRAVNFHLIPGLEILRQLAALPRISSVFPISFVFTFKKI